MERYHIDEIIEMRGQDLCWYVLIYDRTTTEYLTDEIEFQNYENALCKWNETKIPFIKNHSIVVELIFAPFEDDPIFDCNEIIKTKSIEKLEKLQNKKIDIIEKNNKINDLISLKQYIKQQMVENNVIEITKYYKDKTSKKYSLKPSDVNYWIVSNYKVECPDEEYAVLNKNIFDAYDLIINWLSNGYYWEIKIC